MEARALDLTDPEVLLAVETGYYVLYAEDLRCTEQVATPSTGWLCHPAVTVIGCYDTMPSPTPGGEPVAALVGLLAVKGGMVYYPVMAAGRYEEVLAAMIATAREEVGPLQAQTGNEVILTTAVDMGLGVERDGDWLEFT